MKTGYEEAAAILEAYCRLPDTPDRARRRDRRLADRLVARGVSFSTIETAFLLATARRRQPGSARLPPIRSLRYFLPIIEELRQMPPEPGYLDYLRHAVGTESSAAIAGKRRLTTRPSARQRCLFDPE